MEARCRAAIFVLPERRKALEGFFWIFKRGMKGIYQHCGEQHLHRYLAEFDFRYSNRAKLGIDDTTRADKALKGIEAKRLTYRRIKKAKTHSQKATAFLNWRKRK